MTEIQRKSFDDRTIKVLLIEPFQVVVCARRTDWTRRRCSCSICLLGSYFLPLHDPICRRLFLFMLSFRFFTQVFYTLFNVRMYEIDLQVVHYMVTSHGTVWFAYLDNIFLRNPFVSIVFNYTNNTAEDSSPIAHQRPNHCMTMTIRVAQDEGIGTYL